MAGRAPAAGRRWPARNCAGHSPAAGVPARSPYGLSHRAGFRVVSYYAGRQRAAGQSREITLAPVRFGGRAGRAAATLPAPAATSGRSAVRGTHQLPDLRGYPSCQKDLAPPLATKQSFRKPKFANYL
uniref:Uncharacterized protein n=1 Tax=Tanacetum cinerariifolium TaxID=118510 RepID=A0A699U7N1_TANCI|nr:hypothetical protein [Tanacetum cinerariifolium]